MRKAEAQCSGYSRNMAHKKVTRAAGYSRIDYDIPTRTLTFRGIGRTASLVFYAVPAELYYGMPSGTNVQNFIDIKLRGRYSMAELRPPPFVTISRIEREVTLHSEGGRSVWKIRAGEPVALPDDSTDAYEVFARSFLLREPDHVERDNGDGPEADHAEPEPDPQQQEGHGAAGDLGVPPVQ